MRLLFLLFIVINSAYCAANENDSAKFLKIDEDDFVIGSSNAKSLVIEYSSLSCVHCAHFHEQVLPQVKRDFIDTGRARYVFRSFPTNQPSLKAELLARCVAKDDYLNFVNSLLASQNMWAFTAEYEKSLLSIGKLSGMSDDKIKSCLNDQAMSDKILYQIYEAAKALSIIGTPTVFVNGKRVEGELTYDAISELLN
jgi:protein-disulfide isomerase